MKEVPHMPAYPYNDTSLKSTVITIKTGHDRSFFRKMACHYVVAGKANYKEMVDILYH